MLGDTSQFHHFFDAIGDFISRFPVLLRNIGLLTGAGICAGLVWKALDSWGKRNP